MINQEMIHNQCFSKDPGERIKALEKLRNFFSSMPDKQQAWNDLIRLTNTKEFDVSYTASKALGSAFSHMPDKQQAWNDLHRMTNDKHWIVRYRAVLALGSAFSEVPDKQQAWDDLIRLALDKYLFVGSEVPSILGSAFSHVPNKQQAWNDLLILTNNEDSDVRSSAALALGLAFPKVPDKQQAWNDLHRLTSDEDSDVRSSAAEALSSAYFHVPDKQQAWEDLHRLTNDEDSWSRHRAASTLGSVFSQVPDKQQAWNDLHRLTNDKVIYVRSGIAKDLSFAFSYVPDKQEAWNDLHRLTNDEEADVRHEATKTLGSIFSQIPDKQEAWNDLHRLTNDEKADVRSIAVEALGSAFSRMPDKQQAWEELHRLTNDENVGVRSMVVEALGSAFSQVSNEYKNQTWNDISKLTADVASSVRAYAFHSLGRISVFKASQAEKEEDYRKELEKAIEFYIKASEESRETHSAFCLPLYLSYHTIIFKKQANEEADKYLEEARNAVKGSKNKKILLEIVENLSNALKEIQSLEILDLEGKKEELNSYKKYCDNAKELMKNTEEKAPYATEALRKGLPLLDKKLTELLEEIQKKAKIACKQSIGTDKQEIACAVSREVQKWEISNQEEMSFYAKTLARSLKLIISPIPENEIILNEINKALNEKDLINLLAIISTFIGSIPALKMVTDKLDNLEKLVIEVNSKVDELIIISKPGIKEEFEISSGIEILGIGAKHIVKVPLQEISYAELKEDLERIKGKNIEKLSQLPIRLAEKLRTYFINIGRSDILTKLL